MYKAIISAVLFIIAAVIIRFPAVQSVDVIILQAVEIIRQPFLTQLFNMVTHLGSGKIILPLLLLLTAILAVYKKAGASLYVYLLFFAERMANEGLKDWISRERPSLSPLISETSFSFPSGHSMNAAAMYPFIAYLLLTHVPFFKKRRTSVMVWTGVLITLVGFSRMYLGVHYTTDVIGGVSLGFALFVIFGKIAENFPLVRQK
ncbi:MULTISPECIES: phosphatase PAP2 family protein [Bacillus]|uniref:Phosphatase PAP2 family protein n=1 Tax=Bacillus glycinifermentans TaxID=1664069 RepID=A0AAJ4D2R4_9BACI|nr:MULTISPECIES: phosphatase PAP2 family protein [Bacillus]KKB75000.1 phosphatase [Bacillus sp. TH008]MDU0071056.1 phosphatase PAP2 family protein [Bacillus sp. IG6]MED8018924.1 phosphatase PAP2 family protein [Bacillus glycinifermentans]QAT65699.1 phosphatase PAP2 family protein [Bacillus glycinifermentans]WKB75396.1 phosphatase PAP2 family protein [Bacillus glycinifermentans]